MRKLQLVLVLIICLVLQNIVEASKLHSQLKSKSKSMAKSKVSTQLGAKIADGSDLQSFFFKRKTAQDEDDEEEDGDEDGDDEDGDDEDGDDDDEESDGAEGDEDSSSSDDGLEDDSSSDDGSFVHRGWLKYFTYIPGEKHTLDDKPSKFDLNEEFADQEKIDHILAESDDDDSSSSSGPENETVVDPTKIPDDTHFFFILTKDTLFSLSHYSNSIAKTVRSLQIQWIEDIKVDAFQPDVLKGGLEDIGDFKEGIQRCYYQGFCFRLNSKTEVVWNLCADTNREKVEWMHALSKLIPHVDNKNRVGGDDTPKDIKLPINTQQPVEEEEDDRDGEWIVLQDWSECTLACGGGEMFLQRVCKPPTGTGAPCEEGPEILKKDCNKQPCPDFSKGGSGSSTEVRTPVVRAQKISNRPQRYELCELKEEDVDIMFDIPGATMPITYPARVVLNNHTISIFTGTEYETVYKSFDLQYVSTQVSHLDDEKCFVLADQRDGSKNANICILAAMLTPEESFETALHKWIYDIAFFRDNCKDKDRYVEENSESDAEEEILEVKEEAIAEEKQEDELMRIKIKDETQREATIQAQVQATKQEIYSAINREHEYEMLAIKEEEMREDKEQKALELEFEKEKESKECLERQIQQKQKAQDLANVNLEATEKIEELQEEAKKEVEESRSDVYKKIEIMRKAAERRRREQRARIQEIRSDMASKILSENKSGDKEKCHPTQDSDSRKAYCKSIPDNAPNLIADCMSGTVWDFCYACCDNEFGKIHELERKECEKTVCDQYIGDNTDNGHIKHRTKTEFTLA